jgi:thiol-disulfide isomerase/thioredoxin
MTRFSHALWLFAACIFLAPPAPSADAGAIRPFDRHSFTQIRGAYAHKPLVVHIWGLTCGPCLAELPTWGQMRKAHPDMNLVLIQADEGSADAVEAAVEHAGLKGVDSWSTRSEIDEFERASIDPSWVGDMPRTLLISADGAVTTLKGVVDPGVISRWLSVAVQKGGKGVE